MDEWDLTIQYKSKTETWIAGEQRVAAMTASQATDYNNAVYRTGVTYEDQPGGRAFMTINPNRGDAHWYRGSDIIRSCVPPPLENECVQSAPIQGNQVPREQPKKGNVHKQGKVAHLSRKPSPTPNNQNGNGLKKSRMPSPNPKPRIGPGNKPKDLLLRAAADVVLKPRSIRKVQVTYPSVPNPPGKQHHHFLIEATDATGKPVDPDEPVEVGTLSAVVRLQRGQQATGNKFNIFMVNDTDQYQPVLANTVVGRGTVTQERVDLAERLSQVGADPHIQRVYGVQPGGKKDSPSLAPRPNANQEFLDSMDLNESYWYMQASAAQRQRINELLLGYRDVFTDETQKVGRCDIDGPFKITLEPGTKPVKSRDRSLKPDQLDSLKQQLQEWEADSVIGPSDSPWASPLVPVLKKDGSTRWAVDYRALNLHTVPDSFPTPRIAEVLEGLAGSKVFSTLDAAQAYHNIPVAPESQSLTAFVCHFGLFLFKRMPFGLRNAGAKYCRIVQSLVDSLEVDGVLAYLDDLLLHTVDVDTHIDLMGHVLEAHRTVGIKLKAAKTRWLQRRVSYLGYDVSEEGIHLTSKFIEQVRDWPAPTSGAELASMLGFFGYYRESLPEYSALTADMNSLKSRRKWTGGEWTPEMQRDFETLKKLFVQDGGPVRAHPMVPDGGDAGEFVLATDWSEKAMAGVLHQYQYGKLRFIAARGRKCRGYEARYHSSKGELAALHYALSKFEKWLRIAEFTVLSDNTTCTNWATMEVTNGCIRRWVEYFTLFNFRIKHVPGKFNIPPDTMSRRTDLPNPTPSEFRQGQDVEPRFPLDPKLPQLPSESSVVLAVTETATVRVNPDDPCFLGQRCQGCQVYLTVNGITEPSFPGTLNGAEASRYHHSVTPFSQQGQTNPSPRPLSLAVIEAQQADPSYNAFRTWVAQGKKGTPPHRAARPSPSPQPLMDPDPLEVQWLERLQDEDPREMQWLGEQELELVDLTRQGRTRAGKILVRVQDPSLPADNFSRYRVVCPPSLRQHLIEQMHTKGHWGVGKTVQALKAQYSWPRMQQQVAEFLTKECWVCIEKQQTNLKQGVHVPRVAHEQGEIIYVDLVGPFSDKITPFRYLLTVMDGFSRYVAVAPLSSKSSAEVSQAVLDCWVKIHGVPRTVYSDRGTEFTARLTQNLFQELGIQVKLGTPENHQANPIERFHRTLYDLVKSLRQEGETNFLSGVRTAVMLYNGSVHSSLGVTPNRLKFGHEVPGPADMILGQPPLGPEDGPPGVIADRLRREMQAVIRVVTAKQKLAVDRNTKYYTGLTQQLEPGDLVFAFTERKGDPTPHRKLKLKWAGPFVFISQVNPAMVEIGTMQSRLQPTQWKCETFLIHRSKLRLYQRRVIRPRDEQPYRDPADLPQFDASDRNQAQNAMTDCFSDIVDVRREHVEQRQGDQIPQGEVISAPPLAGGGGSGPLKPLDPLEEALPAMPPFSNGEHREKSGGAMPLQTGEGHFVQGGYAPSGGGFAPPARPPSPNQTFADGLARREQDEPPDPAPDWRPISSPADATPADEVYPTAEWPGQTTSPAEGLDFGLGCMEPPNQMSEFPELPDVQPYDSVSQTGWRLPQPHRELDIEDYHQDHGTRHSLRKTEQRRNRHRSEQTQHRQFEYQKRRAIPDDEHEDPTIPSPTAVRPHSDPGPPPTPALSPSPAPSTRTKRASKRQSNADSPNPLCSEQATDRRLGRSSAKILRPLTTPPAGPTTEDPTSPTARTVHRPTTDKTQEVLFINQSGKRTKKYQRSGKQRDPPLRVPHGGDNDVFFRCREDLDFPAVNRAREVFIPVELHFRQSRALTTLELENACDRDNKVILLYWNRSVQLEKKVRGMHSWFQHNRRRDGGFPFPPGAAACIQIPKNVHFKVRAGYRLGRVAAVENVGLERLPEKDEYEDVRLHLHQPSHPPMHPPNAHNRRSTAEAGVLPGPSSTSASSAYYSL